MIRKVLFLFLLVYSLLLGQIPDSFVDVKELIPGVILDMRYFTSHNFVGSKIDGYEKEKCYLTKEAAYALKKVQEELLQFGLSLKIYDAYRPQRAVNHFVRWAREISDTLTKREFYPTVDKRNLFKDGFIASRSGHSRGSTVDLTIVPYPAPEQEKYFEGKELCECYFPADRRFKDNSLDMGTGFDCFHRNSATLSLNIPPEQRANRMLLKYLMDKHGFRNLPEEWWHYTLRNEPFPDTYFDFPIQ